MIKKLPLALALMICCFTAFSQGNKFERLLHQADSAYKAANYAWSVDRYDEALNLPDSLQFELHSVYYYNIACAHSRNKNTQRALDFLEQAFQLAALDNGTPVEWSQLMSASSLDFVREEPAFKRLIRYYRKDEIQTFETILAAIKERPLPEFSTWRKAKTYDSYDWVSFNGKTYKSQMDNNNGNEPVPDDTLKWKAIIIHPDIAIENLNINSRQSEFEVSNALKVKYASRIKDGRLKLNAQLLFEKCDMNQIGLTDIDVDGISFDQCKISWIRIYNCNTRPLSIRNGAIDYVEILNTTIQNLSMHTLELAKSLYNEKPMIFIGKSKLQTLSIEGVPDNLRLHISESRITGMGDWNRAFFFGVDRISNVSRVYSLEILNSTIGHESDSTGMLLQGRFSQVNLRDSHIYSNMTVFNSPIQDWLQITDCHFYNKISFSKSTLPEETLIKWDQLANGKLSKYHDYNLFDKNTGTYRQFEFIISGEGEGVENVKHFDEIMRSYQVLFNIYKNSGDLESANGNYAEMKDLQLKRFRYLYQQEGTFKSFFRWKLAQIMKFYTNHGTDPARAIVISIWVVFLFGIFYFFFPSDWDVTSKAKLIQNYRDFIEKNEKGYVKPFFVLLLGFSISMMNAVFLSLNSFTTLGFGNIPTHGIARYFCILEGFIGWFLLSIFTVALINQV